MAENTPLKKLNPEQERAAYWEENAVVAAGAGSGKTSVLASRYLWLVTEKGYTVEEILTLTFTRKAAAEMYQRIHAALAAKALAAGTSDAGAPADPPAGTSAGGRAGQTGQIQRERARSALEDFFHARIQTLDSYSAYIVKQAASRYGIRPDFTVDEDRCRQLAEEEALPFLISRRNHPALERLYRTKKPADMGKDIFAAAAFKYSHIDEPPSYAGETLKRFEKIRAEWAERRPGILSLLEELSALAGEGGREDKFLALILPLTEKFRSSPDLFPGPEEIRDYFSALAAEPEGGCVNLAEAHPLRERMIRCLDLLHRICRANMSGGKRNSRAKEICRELRAGFREFSSLLVFCVQGGLILSLMALLDEFQRFYLDKKRAEGALSFTDIARLARTILRDHPDIRYNEKTAFQAIMIDEFQDNNSLQKELLFLLAEKTGRMEREIPPAAEILPGKLFFVGDEKQSIYRFRGADVSVFRSLARTLNHGGGGSSEAGTGVLNLVRNYRSGPALIEAFNRVFGGPVPEHGAVFLPDDGALPGFEAVYHRVYAPDNVPGENGAEERQSPAVHFCFLDKGRLPGDDPRALTGYELEAAYIAERIREMVDSGWQIRERTSEGVRRRPCGYSDFVILQRSYTHQGSLERQCKNFGVPFSAERPAGIFNDAPVN
ncbi:MAG: UvrD-helicase domain-containing protein, partial [Treponema sp.]|nr:UvrD-helicase domain-containing protein [Treponema sp.]